MRKRKAGKGHQAQATRRIVRRETQPALENQDRDFFRGDSSPAFKPQKPKKKWKKIVLRFVVACLLCFTAAVVILGISVVSSTKNDDLWLLLEQVPYRGYSVLYYTDAQTGEFHEYTRLFTTQNWEYLPSENIPDNLKNAFVAIEDKDFYNHKGVNIARSGYAALNELKRALTGSYFKGAGGQKFGASTIHQQLIKNLTRDDENSGSSGYMRKLREMYRAYKLNKKYDKDTVLTAYLNVISFTDNTAGVEAEAQKLFGKSASDLTLAECASIASITRNPSRYNPVTNPEKHLERRDYVLYEMHSQGYITQEQYDEALAIPLELHYNPPPKTVATVTSYFTDTVIENTIAELMEKNGINYRQATDLLYNGGLRIYTTLVPELQANMEQVMESALLYPRPALTVTKQLVDEAKNPMVDENGQPVIGPVVVYPQAAMISLDYSGGICAVVGGLGEKEISRGFNRATNAVRQVGSTMKTIGPYVVALERNKITWSSSFFDGPVMKVKDKETGKEKDWPVNVTKFYTEKDILVWDAFAQSVNTVAVRVGQAAGKSNMYNFVKKTLEINTVSPKDKDYSPLVLGSSTYGITPLDMAKSYAIFGNGGFLAKPYSFTHITNGYGVVLLQLEPTLKKAISDDTAYIMNRMMMGVLEGAGTASGLWIPGEMESVGKTGTTDDKRDHWFVGLTPYYVTASWYGYDDNLPLEAPSGWSPPTLAWREVMTSSQKHLAYKEFPQSENVVNVNFCLVSGSKAGSTCPHALGYYRAGHLPAENCPVHGNAA